MMSTHIGPSGPSFLPCPVTALAIETPIPATIKASNQKRRASDQTLLTV